MAVGGIQIASGEWAAIWKWTLAAGVALLIVPSINRLGL
jgi:hypothetical protein